MNWFHRKMMAAVTLMSVAGPAMADKYLSAPGGNSAWTVYAFGNAQALSDAFRALNNFASSSTFQSIVGLIAMLGVLGVGMSSGFSSMVARKFIGYVVGVFIVTYLFFGVGSGGPVVVSVEVMDTVDQTWVSPVTVPAVIGVPASIISNAGMEITRQIEASFPLPEPMKMSNGAPFNLSAALLADAARARITDQNLASSLAYYVQDCFTLGVAQGQVNANTLIQSTDFINDIRVNLAAVYVNTLLGDPVGEPGLVTCNRGWDLINEALIAHGADADGFLNNASAWHNTPALSVVNAAADAVASHVTSNQVSSGGSLVKQAAVLSAFTGAFKQSAAATGNNEFLTALGTTQALQTQVTGWLTGAEIFNRIMGYVYAIIQVFVFAILPLVLAASLVPGLGLALIKNFGQILLWLAIWQPMLAIVNFIIVSVQQAELGGALHAGANAYNFTMANMGIVTERSATMRAAGSFIGTMVPALAWALVKGSVDFSSFIASATGERFAQTAANTQVTGNYSLNQASMDSFTANKNSIAANSDFGHGTSVASGITTQKHDTGGIGNVTAGGGAQQANVAIQANRGTTAGGNTNDASSLGDSNTHAKTHSTGEQRSLVGANTYGGGVTDTQGATTMVSAGSSGGLSLMPGKNGSPSVVPGGAPGAPGALGADPGAGAPAEIGKEGIVGKVARKLNPRLDGTLSATAMSNQAHTQDFNRKNMVTASASATDGATQSDANSSVVQNTNGAALTQGYQKGQTQTYSAMASLEDRYDVARRELTGGGFLTSSRYAAEDSAEGRFYRGLSSDGAKSAHDAAQPGGFDAAYHAEKNRVADEKTGYDSDLAKRKAEADKKVAEEEARVKAERANFVNAAEGAAEPAKKSALGAVADRAEAMASEFFDKDAGTLGTNPPKTSEPAANNAPGPQARATDGAPAQMADAGLDGLFNGDKPAQAAPVQLADARPGQARETTQAEPEPQGEGGDPYGSGNRNSSVA